MRPSWCDRATQTTRVLRDHPRGDAEEDREGARRAPLQLRGRHCVEAYQERGELRVRRGCRHRRRRSWGIQHRRLLPHRWEAWMRARLRRAAAVVRRQGPEQGQLPMRLRVVQWQAEPLEAGRYGGSARGADGVGPRVWWAWLTGRLQRDHHRRQLQGCAPAGQHRGLLLRGGLHRGRGDAWAHVRRPRSAEQDARGLPEGVQAHCGRCASLAAEPKELGDSL